MRAILTIILNDLRIFFSNRGNLIGLVVIPVALTLVVGWSLGEGDGATILRVDVLDLDQSTQSARLIDQLRSANDTLVFCPTDHEPEEFCQLPSPLTLEQGMERARNDTTSGLLVIPAGFATALATFQPLRLDFYSSDDPALPGPVAQTVESVLQRVNSAAVAARVGASLFIQLVPTVTLGERTGDAPDTLRQTLYANAQRRLDERASVVRYMLSGAGEQPDSPVSQGFGQSVPGMGSMYVMFTVLGGMTVLLRERRQWTLQRLAVLPLSRVQILGGKIGAYFALGMIQFLVVFAVGLLVDLDFGRNLAALLALMIAFVLCVTALTFALATRVTSEGQANGLRNLLGLTLAPLGGAWWPLEIVPGFMQTLGHLSPVAWAMDGFHKLIFNQGNFGDVVPEIGVLLGAAAIFLVIGSRSFRIS